MKSKLQSMPSGMTEINLTSLIDVALVLVVIFMVMAPMVMSSRLTISAPNAGQTASQPEQTETSVELYLKRDGDVLLNDVAVSSASLTESLRRAIAASAKKQVVISAEEEVIHERVVSALDAVRQAGAKELSLVKRRSQ